ncbi:MAG TPA: cytochrome c [Candidatus Baltobacteraceae bacterium]|nr:cytochrome c [Candidatus Baltobacteraceae bacterium]
MWTTERRQPETLAGNRRGHIAFVLRLSKRGRLTVCLLVGLAILVMSGCRQDMAETGRIKPLEPSPVFDDHRSARPLVPGTVARDQLWADEAVYTGRTNNAPVTALPVPLTLALVKEGRERFEIFCAPCHGRTGYGDGMVVQRGFRPPPSYHTDRLRQVPIGHFFAVMTYGYGNMPDYAAQVTPEERWAIAAYIRALQLSQDAKVATLPEPDRLKIEQTK